MIRVQGLMNAKKTKELCENASIIFAKTMEALFYFTYLLSLNDFSKEKKECFYQIPSDFFTASIFSIAADSAPA